MTDTVKMANVTSDELTLARTRKHDIDNKAFIDGVKKIVKARTIRVNTYIIKEVNDGTMLKIQIEKFFKGVSMGSRWIKGYLSTDTFGEIVGLLDAIPRKSYTDTRDQVSRERPVKIVRKKKEAPSDLDLETLWNVEDKG